MHFVKPFSLATGGRVLRLVSAREMYVEEGLNWIMFGEIRRLVLCKRHAKVALVNDLRMTYDILSLCADFTIKEDGLLRIDQSYAAT